MDVRQAAGLGHCKPGSPGTPCRRAGGGLAPRAESRLRRQFHDRSSRHSTRYEWEPTTQHIPLCPTPETRASTKNRRVALQVSQQLPRSLFAVRDEIEDIRRVEIEAVIRDDAQLNASLAAAVEAAREALANAAKHSGSPNITLYAEFSNGDAESSPGPGNRLPQRGDGARVHERLAKRSKGSAVSWTSTPARVGNRSQDQSRLGGRQDANPPCRRPRRRSGGMHNPRHSFNIVGAPDNVDSAIE